MTSHFDSSALAIQDLTFNNIQNGEIDSMALASFSIQLQKISSIVPHLFTPATIN